MMRSWSPRVLSDVDWADRGRMIRGIVPPLWIVRRRVLAALAGGPEPVGVGAGLDDVGVEGEAVDDCRAEARVGEGAGPLAEGGVGGYRNRGLLLAFGEHLEQQFGAAAVEFEIAQFVEAE